MTYQEKVSLIEEGRQRLEAGASWNEFQASLVSLPHLYQKDIDFISKKAISAIEASYCDLIDDQLAVDGIVPEIPNLHQTIVYVLGDERKRVVKNRLKAKIANGILGGEQPKAVLAENAHPLLTKSLAQTAINNVKRRNVEKKEDNYATIGMVITGILVVLRMVFRMVNG
jgi:hypothetical protein